MRNQGSSQLKSIDQDIEELIKEFEQTQIRQNEILSILKSKIKNSEGIRDKSSLPSVEQISQEIGAREDRIGLNVKELTYNNLFKPQIGDEVRIVNPRPSQVNRGKIQGFCRDGKARIKVEGSKKPIDRAVKNIVCVQRSVIEKDGGKGSYKRRFYSN